MRLSWELIMRLIWRMLLFSRAAALKGTLPLSRALTFTPLVCFLCAIDSLKSDGEAVYGFDLVVYFEILFEKQRAGSCRTELVFLTIAQINERHFIL